MQCAHLVAAVIRPPRSCRVDFATRSLKGCQTLLQMFETASFYLYLFLLILCNSNSVLSCFLPMTRTLLVESSFSSGSIFLLNVFFLFLI